ncbi:ArsR family transcriptional regulator [Romboutsia weinsteinii]|uniref:ArsR family transcriptional regulator n=1 Tax=Romboutsia weinsteinii TaxID=2020949 RepID=A0A371J2I9_9FIRM|nr:metalloregulator ArsR/SmtB family transcription factor [Romboutsia weinsteinii]RDY27021.1 ArsR family transcriptional regulator [Romboutsia weinsteinii]
MDIKIEDKLNPICEILGLLFVSQNYEMIVNESIKELNSHGINGELFIKRHFKIIDKYIKAFDKYKKVNNNELFLLDEEDAGIFTLLSIGIIENEEIMTNIDDCSEEKLKREVLDAINDVFEIEGSNEDIDSTDKILEFIDKLDLSKNIKWRLLVVLKDLKKYYKELVIEVENNRQAYNEAYKVVEKYVPKLISDFTKYIGSGECELLNNIKNSEQDSYVIVPTLSMMNSFFEYKNTYHIGLLYELIYKEQIKAMGNKGELVLQLKALADKSKLEIVSLLKSEPMYSLEIAERLGLTPATVSYHMTVLLESNMVIVEKKNGKVYYSLNSTGIEKFIEELNRTLL